ncbi:MAG: hypothetical protein FWH11_09600 [Micrococcales bacterium]|nr:hypothetical protein [Micrococcales bacterium]
MGTTQVRRAAAGLAFAVGCVGLAGCADDSPAATVSPSVTAQSDPAADDDIVDPLLDVATQVRDALRDEDYATLAALASEDEKVVFEPYSYVTDESFRLSPQEISRLGTSNKVYTWGAYDGSGHPMELSFADYRARFVWDRDYTTAPSFAVDGYLVSGNSLQNLAEHFGPTARWVEYSFPATESAEDWDPDDYAPPGMDWSALRLVFRETGTDYRLIGIVHDGWTI